MDTYVTNVILSIVAMCVAGDLWKTTFGVVAETTVCKSGWTHSETTHACYKIFLEQQLTFNEAMKKCLAVNARLSNIESQEEQHFIGDLILNHPSNLTDVWSELLLGGIEEHAEGDWAWFLYDEPWFPGLKWREGQPDNYENNEDCLGVKVYRQYVGQVNDAPCRGNTDLLGYICKRVREDAECPSDWLFDARTESCYAEFVRGQSWIESLDKCKTMGATLASIGSAKNVQFLKAITTSPRYWVGASYNEGDTGVKWADNTPWWTGTELEPDTAIGTKNQCGFFSNKLSFGNCDDSLPYVCKKAQSVNVALGKPTTSSSAYCSFSTSDKAVDGCKDTVYNNQCSPSVNVAIGKPTTSSSAYSSFSTSDKAVDGCEDKYYNQCCVHTKKDSDPWWQVDLGETVPIKDIIVMRRTDCEGCVQRLQGFSVTVSWTSESGEALSKKIFTQSGPIVQTIITVPANTLARYIKIEIPNRTESLELCEVKVIQDIGECASTPCQNGATCYNQQNSFACQCMSGWTGTNCETDINECMSTPCQNGATCYNLENSFSCQCEPGWTGTNCETDAECPSDWLFDARTESCYAEFVRGQSWIESLDKCKTMGATLASIGSAKNVQFLKAITTSPRYWVGASYNEGDTGVKWADNTPWWTGTELEPDTAIGTKNQCGFISNSKLSFGNCDDSLPYVCKKDVEECASTPCQNGATCYNQQNSFACQCMSGWTGTNCETDINECVSTPCQNGTTCYNLENSFSCQCEPGWTGANCETDIDECASHPCQNGATCNNLQNSFSCQCEPGWTGTNCETDIDECASHPCQNGATCNNLKNRYSCQCQPDWTGTSCETDIDECASHPCQNGATCNNLESSFSCQCEPGWTGTNCETELSDIIKALYITCPLIGLAFVTVVIACVLYRKRRTFLRVSKHNMNSPATNVCSGATGTNYAECSNIGVLGKQQGRVIKEMSREAALPLSEIDTAQGIGLSSQDTVIDVDDTAQSEL